MKKKFSRRFGITELQMLLKTSLFVKKHNFRCCTKPVFHAILSVWKS